MYTVFNSAIHPSPNVTSLTQTLTSRNPHTREIQDNQTEWVAEIRARGLCG